MKKLVLGLAALASVASTPAFAAQYVFTFDTTSTLFGGPPQTVRGVFTTSDTATQVGGQTAYAITGISGTINGTAISGLFAAPGGQTYNYFTTGPTFLDGSGVTFNAGAATNIQFFHQDGVANDQYRLNGNGTISSFGPATSSLVATTSAVPEPAAWLMMIVGFGAIGFSMRRKNKVRTTVSYAV